MATHEIAKGLAGLGRNGDSVLVHMHPAEVAGLQSIAEAHGTSLTINPDTGMPEAFNIGSALASLLPTIAGIALAPETGGASLGLTGFSAAAAPVVGGMLTGAAVAKAQGGNPLLGAATGGLGGYGGSGLASGLAGAGAAQTANTASTAVTPTASQIGGAGASDIMGAQSSLTSSPVYQGGLSLGGGNDLANTAMTATTAPTSGFNNVLTGVKNLTGMGDVPFDTAWNAYKQAGGTATQIGLPLGMAGLAGLEPSDLYPTDKYKEDKYDPNATLNLGGDSGLRLLAEGGLASLYSNPDGTVAQNTPAEGYGAARLDELANKQYSGYAHGGYLDGPGDGMSDSIPATIANRQPARLADGEFVVPADVVSHLGNGSSKAGAQRLYSMMDKVRKARTGTKKQGKQINPHNYLPA